MHAIKHMQPPSTATEARSLLGLVITIARFFVDFLSRKPVTTNTPRDPLEDYANSIVVDSLPSAITLQELLLASESDPTLKTIKECLDTGNWSAAPAPFADLKEEICQKRGIILRNSHIVIPYALRPRILQLAHEGHQDITASQTTSLVAWHRYSSREICTRMRWLPNRRPNFSPRTPQNDRSTKASVAHNPHWLLGPIPMRRVSLRCC